MKSIVLGVKNFYGKFVWTFGTKYIKNWKYESLSVFHFIKLRKIINLLVEHYCTETSKFFKIVSLWV